MRIPIEKAKDHLRQLGRVRIWSGQWGKYWGKHYSGYTTQGHQAGIYFATDAYEHTKHVGPEKEIYLEPVNALEEMHNYLEGAQILLDNVYEEYDGCFCDDYKTNLCDKCVRRKKILDMFETLGMKPNKE